MICIIFLAIITFLYVCLIGIFLFGLKRNTDFESNTDKLFASVIIAARNEENNISACLESVVNQTYPSEYFEIVVVNDGSEDRTESICLEYAKKHSNLKVVNAQYNSNMRGKANALAQGIEASKGEIIIITDADCVVPPTWIEEIVKRYDKNVGLVGGFTIQKATNTFEGIQSLDWTFILGMAAAWAGLKYPLGSIGNNLSFRRQAYEESGGYRKIKFSVTEDYTVVQAIVSSPKKWKYIYPINPKMLVESKPCKDLKTLISQKHRWGKGGLDMKFAGLLIMAIGFLMHISPFIMIGCNAILEASMALMVKFTADYFYLHYLLKKIGRVEYIKWFYWFELYFIIYVIALPFLVFFGGRVEWKGRKF